MKRILFMFSVVMGALTGWSTMPDGVCAETNLIHRWSFTSDASDSIGGTKGTLTGATVSDGHLVLKGGTNGKSFVNLGTGLTPTNGTFTVELWGKETAIKKNGRVFDIGTATTNYIFMSWNGNSVNNTGSVGYYYKPASMAYNVGNKGTMQFALGTSYHIALSCAPQADGTTLIRFSRRNFKTGLLERSDTITTGTEWSPSMLAQANFWLGRSRWGGDYDAAADYDEVRIWDVALTEEQLAWSARLGPDKLPTTAMDDPSAIGTLTVNTEENVAVAVNGSAAVSYTNVVDLLSAFTTNTLSATAQVGFRFKLWTGDTDLIAEGAASDATVKVVSARAVALTATYERAISTWSGLAGDGLWSTQGNWKDFVPADGSGIVFGASDATNVQNDVIGMAGSLTFTAEAPSYTIGGRALDLPTLVNASTATQTLNVAVTSADILSLPNEGTVVFGEPLAGCGIAASGAGQIVLAKGFAGDEVKGFALSGQTTEVGGVSTGASLFLSNANTRATFTSGSTLAVTDAVTLGQTGSGAQTLDLDGATMTSKTLEAGRVAGTTGTLNLIDAAALSVTDTAVIGRSGTGTVNQSDGTATFGTSIFLGHESTAVGTYNLAGGEANAGTTYVGRLGKGVLNVSGTGRFRTGVTQLGIGSGAAIGVLNVQDGGVLESTGVRSGHRYARSELTVDGGTIQVAGAQTNYPNFFDGLSVIRVGAGGMTLDTGDNAVALNEAMSTKPTTGTITKKGSGTLYLPTTSAAVGGLKVEEGTVVAANAISLTTTVSTKARTVPHLLHRWSFDQGTLVDEVTGAAATSIGKISYTNGCLRLPGGANGTGYVNLGANLLPTDGRAFTVEIFATPRVAKNNSRIFSFGDVTKLAGHKDWDTTFMMWTRGTTANTDLVGVVYNGQRVMRLQDTLGGYTRDTPYHITFVCRPNACGNGKMTILAARETLTGSQTCTGLQEGWLVASVNDLNPARFWLGHSLYSGDNDAAADYDEVRIWDVALTPEQSRRNAVLGADTLPNFNGGLVHRWSFNGTYEDSVGGQTALACGTNAETKIAWDDAANPKSVQLTGDGRSTAYISLGQGVVPCSGDAATIEFWATKLGEPSSWEMLFALGDDANNNHLYMCLNKDNRRVELKLNNAVEAYKDQTIDYAISNRYHIAMTIQRTTEGKTVLKWSSRDDTGTVKYSGSATTQNAYSLDALFFGKSTFYLGHTSTANSTEKDGRAAYDEVRVWRGALSDAQLVANAQLGPDTLPTTVDYAETAGDASVVANIDLGADGTFQWNAPLAVETVKGTGTLSGTGTLTVGQTLDVAGTATGRLTLDGTLAVTGTFLVDAAGPTNDCVVGTGSIDLSQATLEIRDPSLVTADRYELVKGPSVTGLSNASVPGYQVHTEPNRLVLLRLKMIIFIR